MTMPVLFNLEFQGDEAKLDEVVKATVAEVGKDVPKGIVKVLEVTLHDVSGKTVVDLGLEVRTERFSAIRSALGRIWRRIAYEKGALPEEVIKKMREMGEIK
jgi:hypothetical protein